MSPEEQYRQARAQAEQRKAAFLSSATAAKARVAPARLKEDARHKLGDSLTDGKAYVEAKFHERPIAMSAAAGALALYLFRKPLWALFKPVYVRITNRTPDNITETDDG